MVERTASITRQNPGDARTDKAGRPRVLIAAFSARSALGQLLDEMYAALSVELPCHLLLPTNYSGSIPERHISRARCGISKLGGLLGSISPLAHWDVLAAVWRTRPDVIHILSGEGYLWAVSLMLAARLRRIPVIVTLHDPEPHPGSIFERLNSIVRRPVLAFTQALHLFSSQHVEQARKMARHARFVVIPHGSLAGQFLKYRASDVKRENLVLFFGRIQGYKGIDILLRAMQTLPASTRLAIAGPGGLEDHEQQMVQEMGSRVELHNRHVHEREVARLMQRSVVVAAPYRHATQSSVPAIAAAFGCRIVATALGHFVEEVPRLGGILVSPEDPEALAAGLQEALDKGPMEPVATPGFDELAGSFVDLYISLRDRGDDLGWVQERGLLQ